MSSQSISENTEKIEYADWFLKNTRKISIFLMVLVIASTLEIPEWFVLIFKSPIPWIGRVMPYFGPLLFVIIGFNWAIQNKIKRGIKINLNSVFLGLFVFVLFMLELIHSINHGQYGQYWLMTGFFWLYISYVAISSFEHISGYRDKLIEVILKLIVCMALVQVILGWMVGRLFEVEFDFIEWRLLFDSAHIAYLSVFAIALILFELKWSDLNNKYIYYLLVIPFLIFVIYQQRMAGPLLVSLMLFGLKLFVMLSLKFRYITIILGVLGMLYLVFYSVLIVSNTDEPTLKGFRQGAIYFDESKMLHGDIVSSYIRKETIIQQLRVFLEHPFFGVGLEKAGQIKVLFYGMHSNLIYILVTTGLVGFSMFLISLIYPLFTGWHYRRMSSLALPMVMLSMMLLSTETFWWWAFVFYLSGSESNDQFSTS